ncbi:hypothetical protein KC19_5G109900 [Ceratodon purpureus]|uniref:Uncharacterized protein n=1 Tax=Ceratodon purpureus TaxID=3225 RepID=A0A8T0I2N1_CERPU|nr:hypothetical protein KC19_5G109900 [Ceratodon purpureus]
MNLKSASDSSFVIQRLASKGGGSYSSIFIVVNYLIKTLILLASLYKQLSYVVL